MRASLFLLLFILCAGSPALALEYVATIKDTQGQVSVKRGDQKLDAGAGFHLQQNDIVLTGDDSSTGFIFIDGTRISLGPDSEIDLSEYAFNPAEEEYAFDLFMKKGSAVYSSGKLSKLAPDSVNVRTPMATVGIRGTKFCIKVQ